MVPGQQVYLSLLPYYLLPVKRVASPDYMYMDNTVPEDRHGFFGWYDGTGNLPPCFMAAHTIMGNHTTEVNIQILHA